MSFKIAIDGPAATGKSTTAKRLSRKLSFIYIDTGAMYRAMGLYFIENNISYEDEETINQVCDDIDIDIYYEDDEQHIKLNGRDVTKLIRTEEVSKYASVTSSYLKVREKLVALQRKLAEKNNVIMDGRDIGTVVLPNAELKVFLTATSEERARRRYEELLKKGQDVTLESVSHDLEERDHRDSTRANSPLRQADDAILIDTTNLSVDEVVEKIEELYNEKRGK
ncbi:MAG: (d)CMP kinase [Bacilli bacterium]|nr:(d)CMP kinase [Bacilli bacterium]